MVHSTASLSTSRAFSRISASSTICFGEIHVPCCSDVISGRQDVAQSGIPVDQTPRFSLISERDSSIECPAAGTRKDEKKVSASSNSDDDLEEGEVLSDNEIRSNWSEPRTLNKLVNWLSGAALLSPKIAAVGSVPQGTAIKGEQLSAND
ncbi:unnamed protein product [Gongylonema pulchrum]|uniref:Uncharacterized protein n=1 Tax=Gongylonema pulchrum TaxID=637853 RepID=A0A183EG74_9BILA|nr:unnamed protein product [Gongylonema pulchrum]